MRLHVEYLDGTEEDVNVIPWDVVGFEEHFNEDVPDNPRMRQLLWLVWHAKHRTDLEHAPDVEAFGKSISGLEDVNNPAPLEESEASS